MAKNLTYVSPDPPDWWNSLTAEEQEKYSCAPPRWKYNHLTLEESEETIRRIAEEDAKLTRWPPTDFC